MKFFEKINEMNWLKTFKLNHSQQSKVHSQDKLMKGLVVYYGHRHSTHFKQIIEDHGLPWQQKDISESQKEVIYFVGQKGPVWIIHPQKKSLGNHYGLMDDSQYSWSRETGGALVSHFKLHHLQEVSIEFIETNLNQELGFFVGLGLAAYSYRLSQQLNLLKGLPQVYISKKKKNYLHQEFVNLLNRAQSISNSVNLARHLVNLPPNELTPSRFSEVVTKNLTWSKNTQLKIWDSKKLQKENMNLILAVGGGSANPPCLVHLKYRPSKSSKKKPIAFIGKGITFDTGGLDIKPSSGMRLMKKDMGGAASVLALAYWVNQTQYPDPVDFYLALAENSVGSRSFRPSDIFRSRSGIEVEIDNTDAEGRLVLADVLDLAIKANGEDEVDTVIDIATLTGAIKVALGTETAGLFCNDDLLADQILKSSSRAGDWCWRMPLVEKYNSTLNSSFADIKNSADGFGGAITAALFLQKFIGQKKWAHLDIYAWCDKPTGAISTSGGNGQSVQAMIDFLINRL